MMCLRTWSISAKKQYWTEEKNLQKITYGNLNLEKKRFYSLWSWWDLWIYEWGRLIPMNGLSGCMEVKGVYACKCEVVPFYKSYMKIGWDQKFSSAIKKHTKNQRGGGPHRQNDGRRFDLLNPQQFDCALHCNRGPDFDALTNFPILNESHFVLLSHFVFIS